MVTTQRVSVLIARVTARDARHKIVAFPTYVCCALKNIRWPIAPARKGKSDKIAGVPCPLAYEVWEQTFVGDPDLPYVVDGLRHGFRIVDNVDVIPQYDRDNYDSAENDTAKPLLDKLFAKELSLLGRISRVVNRPHCAHSIGAVEKKRVCRPSSYCSSPSNDSINAYMDYPNQRFKPIDHACKFMSPNC